MKRVLLIIVCIGTISCDTDVDTKTVDFEKFTIQVPGTWNGSPQQGFDSFVGQIETSDKELINFDLGRYSNKLNVDAGTHDIYFVTIDNKRAKIVKPKDFGSGTTGVYFDSLEITKSEKFQISGRGLSSINQKFFLAAIETLKFRN